MTTGLAMVAAAQTRTSGATDLDALWNRLTTEHGPETFRAPAVDVGSNFDLDYDGFTCFEERRGAFAALLDEAVDYAIGEVADSAGPLAVVVSSIMGSRADRDWDATVDTSAISRSLAVDIDHIRERFAVVDVETTVVGVGSGCAAGTSAVGIASTMVASGRFRAAVVIGVEAVSLEVLTLFRALAGLSTTGFVRPFDADRAGMLPGEGWGVLVLHPVDSHSEEIEFTSTMPSRVVVAGYGEACDGHDLAAPDPRGSGLRAAIGQAMDQADVHADDLGWVCAHGTGTRANDALEASIYEDVMSSRTSALPIVSVKGVTGHAQGAAGVIEAAVAVRSLQSGRVPANPTLREVDGTLATLSNTILPLSAQDLGPTGSVLSTSYGFGGAVSAIVLVGAHDDGGRDDC